MERFFTLIVPARRCIDKRPFKDIYSLKSNSFGEEEQNCLHYFAGNLRGALLPLVLRC